MALDLQQVETTDGSVKYNLNTKQLKKVVALASRMACGEAMGIVQRAAERNLLRIRAESQWPEPGGYGWWKERIAHGFMRDSFFVASYMVKPGKWSWDKDGRIAGAFFRMSQIFYPIERGTKNGKRGWGTQEGNDYTQRKGSRKARNRMVWDYTGRRGPSDAKPFLWPAVLDNAHKVNEALLRHYEEGCREEDLLVKPKVGLQSIG